MARIVFLGTPEAAVPTLETLITEHEIGLVVTQPDRPKGRSGTPSSPPVKVAALENGIEVAQPETRTAIVEAMREHGQFDVGVVVAYGRILPSRALDIPAHGLLNIHFSLLPRWRGAAPVARALMAGDQMTGVSIMKLDEGLDTGPILTAQAIDIPEHDNAGDLTDRLAGIGARLLAEVLPRYVNGEIDPVAQSDDGATYADKIESGDRPIDSQSEASAVVAKVRALSPEPTATLSIDGEIHKIYTVRLAEEEVGSGTWERVEGRPVAGFAGGAVELVTLQAPGRSKVSGEAWVNGRQSDHGLIG